MAKPDGDHGLACRSHPAGHHHAGLGRRDFLSGLAVAAGAAALSGTAPAALPAASRKIDVHHHFTPKAWLDFHAQFAPPGAPPVYWDLAKDLDDMAASGTESAILSIWTEDGGAVEDRRAAARGINEGGARLAADHPGRFGHFATLPMPDIEGSLAEIGYALDTLKADGITLYADAGNRWLGHPDFSPLHEELHRRKAKVYVHPRAPQCCVNLVKDVTDTVVEFGANTTRTIASLIFSGTTVRYPDITWIFAHGGGVMPFVIERFLTAQEVEIVPGIKTAGQKGPLRTGAMPPDGVLAELRKMYYDTAQISNPVALDALRKVVPVPKILYGTDVWYRTAQESVTGVSTSRVFSPPELDQIYRGNALQLFPRFA